MNWQLLDLTLTGLRDHYVKGDFTPAELVAHLQQKAAGFGHKNIWISQLSSAQLAPWLARLAEVCVDDLPLFGIPFAIKDNIDLAGVATTAACAEFAYVPSRSATVVEQLLAAGCIPLGKTNMDQFATGLVGTRSPAPWGSCRNAFDDDYISGGSSSGSAVAVSLGLASFALGTDTAGSGRVPAAMNNIVGLKPTLGLLSSRGVVPACRSLDTISIFALNPEDCGAVFDQAVGFDNADPYSRVNPFNNSRRVRGVASGGLRLGVPAADTLEFFGDTQLQAVFENTLDRWRDLGADLVEIDFAPFVEAARLLYQGPWVAERYLATQSILQRDPAAMHPVVRQVIEPGAAFSALDSFTAAYRLQALKQLADAELASVDLLLTPSVGRQYRIDELLEEPIKLNSQLGYYTNFMNLLDYCAVALPAGFTARGLPAGCTLVGNKFHDQQLLAWANRWHQQLDLPLGNTGQAIRAASLPAFNAYPRVSLVVCGAHLDGLALNWQLRERGACLLEATHSAPCYRLYALPDGKRPGMIRSDSGGRAIEVEVWSLPTTELGSFVAAIPAPLGIGKVELADGRWESGFICDGYGLEGATDISAWGGWRAWVGRHNPSPTEPI